MHPATVLKTDYLLHKEMAHSIRLHPIVRLKPTVASTPGPKIPFTPAWRAEGSNRYHIF